VALTHTPPGSSGLLDHPEAPDDSTRHRLPRPARASAPVLGVTAMAAALGATGFGATAAAAATPAAPAAPALSAPDQADPGLALTARITQQADVAPGAEEAGQDTARTVAAQQQAARLEAAQEAAAKQAALRAAATAERPAAVSPLPGYPVSTPAATPWGQLRTGVDIAAPAHTPVRAVAAGTVTAAGWSGVYGYRVIQTLPDGTELWYCHLASLTATGGQLAPGELLGQVGASGSGVAGSGIRGPRLHLEVRPGGGAPVDALAWLQEHGIAA
jgi:murein DD-endopeptidase MepM/ murein hydrolase activator NlpD